MLLTLLSDRGLHDRHLTLQWPPAICKGNEHIKMSPVSFPLKDFTIKLRSDLKTNLRC